MLAQHLQCFMTNVSDVSSLLCPAYMPVQCSLSKQIAICELLAVNWKSWMDSLLAKEALSTSFSFNSYHHKGVPQSRKLTLSSWCWWGLGIHGRVFLQKFLQFWAVQYAWMQMDWATSVLYVISKNSLFIPFPLLQDELPLLVRLVLWLCLYNLSESLIDNPFPLQIWDLFSWLFGGMKLSKRYLVITTAQ